MKYLKYLSYILLIICIPTSVFAQKVNFFQSTKGVICGPTEPMMNALMEGGETNVTFLGRVDGTEENIQIIATLHRNKITGSFSVIESASVGMSCMVSVGHGIKVNEGGEELEQPKIEEVPKVIPDKNGVTKTLWQRGNGIAIKFQVSQ
jgi:hypothetical protein